MQIVKSGKKVICGTQSGSLCFFSYGFWGDINDIIIVNKDTVNGIAKISEDLVCTSGDDGEIYIVSIHPNKVIGTFKKYKRLGTPKSTDSIVVNHDKTLLGLRFTIHTTQIAFVGDLEGIYVTSTQEVHSDHKDDFFNDL
ncbi:hypothetical protein BEWA_025790 [Theileria equi strain WA]|uniref:Uncharacterized protein n=1 Tax=Theileria equi strain WA TaxID=1537102 RepID=L0AW01_THEEQ|nr:hypothetical protein BEWA_025790 [Theileria equi strain WA]AFZ79730.1 hypothetical protein BEWA_025790 [Theileria equi strain WA]|eukprot:XP_004829396.1 hypothetical protein BEWA_025790 [Theileria equi strain WA]